MTNGRTDIQTRGWVDRMIVPLQVNIAKHMQVRHQQHALFRGTLHNGRRQ